MEKLLTISIAAYNSEDFIRKTLDSLILPEYMDKLEVFIIDDGGQDKTLDIAREYQDKYPETFIPVHKENGGYGSTVNYSMENATGKYFKLLDGDDWFNTGEFFKLMDILSKEDFDALVMNFYQGCDDESLEVIKTHHQRDGETIDLRNGFHDKRTFEMWELVIRTDILKKSGLRLPHHELYTDRYYTMIPFGYVDTVRFSDLAVYCYRLGRDGQSMGIESQLKHQEERVKGSIEICEFYAEQKRKDNPRCEYLLKQAAERHVAAASIFRFFPKSRESVDMLKDYENKIKTIAPDVVKREGAVSQFGKLLSLCRRTMYIPYWIVPDKILKKEQSVGRRI